MRDASRQRNDEGGNKRKGKETQETKVCWQNVKVKGWIVNFLVVEFSGYHSITYIVLLKIRGKWGSVWERKLLMPSLQLFEIDCCTHPNEAA